MLPSFVVYIDESGDEGFSFGHGSSEWFVLAAAILPHRDEPGTVRLLEQVRTLLHKPPKKPLHFRDIRHEQRLPYLARIACSPVRTVVVLIHKPLLRERQTFQERYRLYFYATRYLLERISWYCRDNPGFTGDGSAHVVFSNRSGMSYVELRQHLDRLQQGAWQGEDVRIDWSVIRPEQVSALTPGKRAGLQIADALAGSFYYAVEPSEYGFTEDRYALILKPTVYSRQGQYLGYGLKFWPGEVDPLQFSWVHKYESAGPGPQEPTL
jgi:hypothetical protein